MITIEDIQTWQIEIYLALKVSTINSEFIFSLTMLIHCISSVNKLSYVNSTCMSCNVNACISRKHYSYPVCFIFLFKELREEYDQGLSGSKNSRRRRYTTAFDETFKKEQNISYSESLR